MTSTSSRGKETETASVRAAAVGTCRSAASRGGAGSRSSRVRCAADKPRVAPRAVPGGSLVESAGVPGPGVLCPPPADGRFSQYWLSALTVGGPAHPAPAWAAIAGGASAALTTTAVIQTLPDIDGRRC